MKKILAMFTILMATIQVCQADDRISTTPNGTVSTSYYVPFLKDTRKRWSGYCVLKNGEEFLVWTFERQDTVIAGITYSVIEYQARETLLFYERQEGKKVYRYDEDTQAEVLMVDYSLEVGDEVEVDGGVKMKVVKTESAYETIPMYGLRNSKMMRLQGVDDETLEDVWVEGVGSIYWGVLPRGKMTDVEQMYVANVSFSFSEGNASFTINTERYKSGLLHYRNLTQEEKDFAETLDPFKPEKLDIHFVDDTLCVTGILYIKPYDYQIDCLLDGSNIDLNIYMIDLYDYFESPHTYYVEAKFPDFKDGVYQVSYNGGEPMEVVCEEKKDYRPFIEDGKVWRVMHGNISGKANFVNYYFSDEEIVKDNGKTYRTLHEQKDEEISPRSVGLLREENGRVYLYDKNTNTEKIAYDFTLNEGDKFELQYEGGLPCEVTKVDSLVQQGNRLKRITFNITNGMGEAYEGTWIEGIGTYEEPLSIYPSTEPNSWSSSLEYVKSEKMGYWAFPFKFYRLRGQPMILGEDHSSEVSEEQWGHDDLHYKFIPGHPIGDDKDTLHVYGKMWLNCAPDQYMYCEEEGLMERNITLHTDAFLEDRDCFGYYDVDLRFPFFSATSGVQYTVTDKEGVHQVELRKDLEYRPFIEEGKVWKVGELEQYGTFLPRLSYYYFDGDTIVGGKACKRMMCRHEANKGFEFEDGSLSYTNYAGAFYEENKQVYFALPTNDWFDRLYDFGAEIGETIDIYDWAKILGPHTSPFTITKKEEENSEFFKGICIEVNEKEELSHIKAVWREGIGGKEGPIHNLSDRDALMSCTVGDEVLYKNPYFEDLYPDIESGETTPTPTAKRRVDFTHVVKKKPKAPQRRVQENEDVAVSGKYTQRALTIDLNALQDTYAVTITDPSGKSVYAKDVKTNRVLALDIDISAYNTEEAYTITLENEDEIFEGNFRLSDLMNDLKYIELTKEERELVKNNNEFAFRLFDKARDDESCIMSPLSITYALGMLNNGADGQTREEINQVLGDVDNAASPELINQFCQKLLTEAPQLDKETTAEIANTIYVNRGTGYELQQGFVDKVNEYYDAQPQALDFYDDATIDIINQWANEHTHGMIPEIVDKTSFDHNAASILLNAIYFKGVWANKFDKAMTQDETFNGVETQPMMHQMEEFLYTENDLYQAVRLPYGNGAYEMTIFLPRKGKTIGEVLSQMDGKNWRPRYQSLYQVDLKMPRFQTETELPLNDTMKELGMPTAFTMGAEFPYFGNRDVFISQMFQKAKIELDEEGTKAAAVTEIWMAESACTDVAEFHANRPFFYIISEQSTGAIFFIGQYMGENPALAINSPALPLSKTNNTYYDLTGRRVTMPSKGIYIHNGKIVLVR